MSRDTMPWLLTDDEVWLGPGRIGSLSWERVGASATVALSPMRSEAIKAGVKRTSGRVSMKEREGGCMRREVATINGHRFFLCLLSSFLTQPPAPSLSLCQTFLAFKVLHWCLICFKSANN